MAGRRPTETTSEWSRARGELLRYVSVASISSRSLRRVSCRSSKRRRGNRSLVMENRLNGNGGWLQEY